MMKLAEVAQNNLMKLKEDATTSQMLERISKCGPAIIFGGAIRDWFFNKSPRDIDIVVDCSSSRLEDILSQHEAQKNKFGGFKFNLNQIEFDIWNLNSTWAFNNDTKFAKTMETVPETVFLNIDAITYCMNTGAIVDKGFTQAIESKLLDIVYEPNPYPYLCVSKALIALFKYDLKSSDKLRTFIRDQVERGYNEACFNRYQKVSYGKLIFYYQECLKRV